MLVWAPTVGAGKESPPGLRTYDLFFVWDGFCFVLFCLFVVCYLGILCLFMCLRRAPLYSPG